jgi:hypothetical protein
MENLTIKYSDQFDYDIKMLESSPEMSFDKITDNQFAVDIWLINHTNESNRPNINFEGKIYRTGFINKLNEMGFFKLKSKFGETIFVKKNGLIVKEVDKEEIKSDFFVNYLQSTGNLCVMYYDSMEVIRRELLIETYLKQQHLIFNEKFLHHLPTLETEFLRDKKGCSFFPFKNGIAVVTKDLFKLVPFDEFEVRGKCIWENNIIPHHLELSSRKNSHFSRFIQNVSNNDSKRIVSLESALGYLLSDYSEPTKGQVIIIYDEALSQQGIPQGGTGKGVIAKALKVLRNSAKIDGKKILLNDRFKWQNVTKQTQIVHLDDIGKQFNFESIYSCSTDGWNVEAKYSPEFFIPPEESPKILITSNRVLDNKGTTNKRRQFTLELSDYYSRQIKKGNEEPILKEHGCTFFSLDEWDKEEWSAFFTYMLKCNQLYHKKGLIHSESININENLLMQETSLEFIEWMKSKNFELNKRYVTEELYEEFISFADLNKDIFKQHKFSKYITLMARRYEWEIARYRSGGKSLFFFKSL